MLDFSSPFFIAIYALLFLLVAGLPGYYLLMRFRQKSVVMDSLKFALFEVSLPKFKKESGQTFKDVVGVMEQFYSGMSSFRPHFVLELVSPATENETNFYVAVPREGASIFEKQVHSVFPKAEIREEKSDYNIFKYRGENVGAYMTLKLHDALPIKTYENQNMDPLEMMANAFSGFRKENEGAAMQIITASDDGTYSKKIVKMIDLIRSGANIKELLSGGSVISGAKKLFLGPTVPKGPGELSAKEAGWQEETINFLKTKISRQVLKVNIRLVASADTRERAVEILNQMKNTFAQFAEPQANFFVANEMRGQRLKNFFFNFSFRLFDEKEAVYLNLAELTSLFHFPAFEMTAPRVKFLKVKKVAPSGNLPPSGLLLGINNVRSSGIPIYMQMDDRRRHFYTIGQTGTGKTAFMKNLIMQDIRAGRGVCFIDPHGDDVEDVLGLIPPDRWDDVVYFNPGDISHPMGLNMLEYDTRFPEQKSILVNELLEIFNKLYDMKNAGGPMFEQYFRNAALLTMDDPDSGNTLLEIIRVLANKDFRHLKLSKSKNEVVKNFWKEIAEKAGGESSLQNMIPYVSSKFDTFLTNEIMRPIVCQQKSAFNFRDIIDGEKIFLINLSKGRLGETNAYLLGMILVGRITMAAMSRADIMESERKDFYLYIDEFQNVTTKTIATVLSEARKYRLSLTMAHQFIGQLTDDIRMAVFGNVGSMAVFRVGNEDGEVLAKQFAPVFSTEDLIALPNYNAYLRMLLHGETIPQFNIETLAPEKGDATVRDKIKELSAIKFGRPRSQIESEINQRYLKNTPIEAGKE